DEDPCGAGDDDGDTLIDEDDPAGDDDCDGFIDEDSAIVPVVLVVTNTISSDDPHVVDNNPDNNTKVTPLLLDSDGDTFGDVPLIIARDITPTWSVTIDEAAANTMTSPVDNDCIQHQPCKSEFNMTIPGNQPFVGQISITPDDFQLSHGFAGMDMTPFTADDPVNGQTAGQIAFNIKAAMQCGDCSASFQSPGTTVYEAHLPKGTYNPTMGQFGEPTGNADDVPSAALCMYPAAAAGGGAAELCWSTNLEKD
ncbi:unnamed protein product, partial [marine sediment metagenome]